MDARIATTPMQFNKAQVASIGGGFTALVPTTTKPTTSAANGVVIYDASSTSAAWNVTPNTALIASPSLFTLVPFTSATTGTFAMRITKFNSYRNAADTATWWIPTTIFDGTIAISTGSPIPTFGTSNPDGTQLYLFSGITSNGSAPTANLYSPGSILASTLLSASITLDPVGAQLITVQFTASTGGPTMGVFWTTT